MSLQYFLTGTPNKMLQEFLEIKNQIFKIMYEENENVKEVKNVLKSLYVKYFQGFKL